MYSLTQKDTFLHLNEDLQLLEFGNRNVRFAAQVPFLLYWADRPLTAENMRNRKVTQNDMEIRIDFSDFRFSARFPGNDYCRPDREYTPDFRFSVTLSLQDGDMIVRISEVRNLGEHSLKIAIAQNFFMFSTREQASWVFPIEYGMRIDFPREDVYSGTFQPSLEWSLPVHALFRTGGGMGFWCDEPDREYAVSFNTDLLGTAKAECFMLYDTMCNVPHEMRFMLFSAGADFRDLARRCRALRQTSGRFKTLAQKIEEHPEAGFLPGTVVWKHNVYYRRRPRDVRKSYSLYVARPDWNENEGLPNNWTAAEIFETAQANGFDRVAVFNTGWNRNGFDAGYPARFPVNPERGTTQEFRDAVEAAHRLSPGYILSVHDNYINAFDGDEYRQDEILQTIKHVLCPGGIWRGGESHLLCSEHGLKYARRDLPCVAELTGKGGIYLDVSAAVPLFCCRSDEHPLTRRQDLSNRRAIFNLAKELFGGLAVEGCGTDYFADIVDIGAYGGLHGAFLSPRAPSPVPVPLWQMVYHDSVLNYFGEGYSPVHGSEYRLYQALYALLPTAFDEHSRRLSFELRDAYMSPMVEFRELIPRTVGRTSDGSFRTSGAALSVFGDGTQVIANFSDITMQYDRISIPPRKYHIIRRQKAGHVKKS